MPGLWRRLLELVRPGQLDREAAEEMQHHLDLLTARGVASGLDPVEARRRARAEAGLPESARQQIADERTGASLATWRRDARYAARRLRATPGLTTLSILTLGGGIGASTLLAALVSGILLQPLPYPDPDRLVRIFDVNASAGVTRTGAASGNLDDWRRRAGAFDGLAGFYRMGRTVSDDAGADVLVAAQVTQDFFEVMRVAPHLGRTFTADEIERATFNSAAAPTGADPVAVVSHGVWTTRFGGDPNVVGRVLVIDRRPFRIIGVMPAGFAMPDRDVEVWVPWGIGADSPRDQHYLGAVARLADGITIGTAQTRLEAVARELGDEHPATNRGWSVQLVTLADDTEGDAASMLWLLVASVGLVLMVACANVALLSLLRGLDRRDDTAVRLALGASPSRIVRESFLESGVLALAGGVAGLAIAAIGLRLLPSLAADLPRVDEVAFDRRALASIATLTILSAILAGLPQAWRAARVPPISGLAAGSRRTTDAGDRHWLRDGIVVAQVAMALMLLTGSGLLIRSVAHLRQTPQGFDPRGVLVAPIFLDNQTYTTGEKTRTYYRMLFEQLAAVPGVTAVGGATTVPTSPLGPDFERPVWPDDASPDSARRVPASVRMVTPGYFEALGLRVADGRAIDDRDAPDAPRVLMVTETLARRLWPGQRAVGRRLVVDYSTAGTYPYEVVGVAGDVRFRGPRSAPGAEIFLPHAQRSYLIMNVVVKTDGDPRTLVPGVRAALAAVDRQVPAHGLHALEDLLGATYARDRQAMATLVVFAMTTVFLAVLSVYGVVSQRVRERTREIGIRMALGAQTPRLVGWVAASGLRLVAIGLAVGALASGAAGGLLEGLLFGVAATDAATLLGGLGVVATIGAAAAIVPSWRAARIDPIRVLRRG